MQNQIGETESFTMAEVIRFSVIQKVLEGECSAPAAARQLRISVRQVFRLKKRVRRSGIKALQHRNLGRVPHNKLDTASRELILSVFRDWKSKTDLGLNCAHLADVLERDHGLRISRQALWRLLRAHLLILPTRRVKKHRLRRARSKSEGALLFLDGSEHHWFGKAHPTATLILCTDDATTRALYGVFVPFEDLLGCFEVAWNVFNRHGLPQAFYLDRASQFITTRKKYELEGNTPLTKWQQAMQKLGVQCIFSNSPQARGRGERINGTFQGRLAAEFQYRKISNLKVATKFLNEEFIPAYNRQFAVPPASRPAWRKVAAYLDLKGILSQHEERHVSNDNTFSFMRGCYQILPHREIPHVAQSKVEVQLGFDGIVRAKHPKHGYLECKLIEQKAQRHPNRFSPPMTKSRLQDRDIFAVT